MTVLGRLMQIFMPSRGVGCALEKRLDAAAETAVRGEEVVRKIVETSKDEAAEAVELSGKTRERLALLEARRAKRLRMDPHVQVVIDTMRMMEGRS